MHYDYRLCKLKLSLQRAAAVYRCRTGKLCITDLVANVAGRLICGKVHVVPYFFFPSTSLSGRSSLYREGSATNAAVTVHCPGKARRIRLLLPISAVVCIYKLECLGYRQ